MPSIYNGVRFNMLLFLGLVWLNVKKELKGCDYFCKSLHNQFISRWRAAPVAVNALICEGEISQHMGQWACSKTRQEDNMWIKDTGSGSRTWKRKSFFFCFSQKGFYLSDDQGAIFGRCGGLFALQVLHQHGLSRICLSITQPPAGFRRCFYFPYRCSWFGGQTWKKLPWNKLSCSHWFMFILNVRYSS